MDRDVLKLAMGLFMILAFWQLMVKLPDYAGSIAVDTDADTGYLVVIDPGHGGVDPGMVGLNDTIEKDINLSISQKLKEKLEDEGVRVMLTRSTDDGLYDDDAANKKIADMKERCRIIEESKADIVVSIHQNGFSDSRVSGGQVFYYKHSAEGAKLAAEIQEAFRLVVDESNDRAIKANDSYYMLIHTPCPTVIVECGFITNPDESLLLQESDYQDKVADAIVDGIIGYLEGVD